MNYLEQYKVNVPEGKSGNWSVEKFEVKENDPGRLYYMLHGRDVPAGTYTRLSHNNTVIMSDTPCEIRDHLGFIHRAKGRCLVNGLGLGVVAKALLENPEVTHIDVVEIEQDVINLVWPTYYTNAKIKIHYGDAFTFIWPNGTSWDCIWHDIWPTLCTDNLEEVTKLKRKYARRTNWQAAWAEELLRYYKRQGG